MGLIPVLNAPVAGNPRVPTPLVANDNMIRTVVNGNIDAANITNGSVTDTELASPNNSVYKMVIAQASACEADLAAGTYVLGTGATNPALSGVDFTAGVSALTPIYVDDADYTVGGLTTYFRLRAQVSTNATAWSSVTATFGLYPVTFAGGADAITVTLGTVVSGSTVALVDPSASTTNSAVGTDFALPADGQYCLGVVTSATLTNNAAAVLSVQLQYRHT